MTVPENETAVPIREISRLTGVNSVTLRAWERRYGLLKPTRTSKGHRLYSREDIQRVKDIQSWLVRGLAIGKVRAVLAEDYAADASTPHDNVWQDYAAQLTEAMQHLNRRKLENMLSELTSIYPVEVIADELFAPALELLQQHRYANTTRREFLDKVVVEHICTGQQRLRQGAYDTGILLIKLNTDEADVLPRMFNYALLTKGYKSEYLGSIPTEEWVFAAEQLQPRFVVLYSDSATKLSEVMQQINTWEQMLHVPLLLSGKITTLLAAQVIPDESAQLQAHLLASGLQQTLNQLTQRFPLRH